MFNWGAPNAIPPGNTLGETLVRIVLAYRPTKRRDVSSFAHACAARNIEVAGVLSSSNFAKKVWPDAYFVNTRQLATSYSAHSAEAMLPYLRDLFYFLYPTVTRGGIPIVRSPNSVVGDLFGTIGEIQKLVEASRPAVVVFFGRPERAPEYILSKIAGQQATPQIYIKSFHESVGRYWACTKQFAPLVSENGGLDPSVIHLGEQRSATTHLGQQEEVRRASVRFPMKRRLEAPSAVAAELLRAPGSLLGSIKRRFAIKRHATSRDSAGQNPVAVYFLHYEPETGIFPSESQFAYQLAAIVRFRMLVPREIPIFVREHPRSIAYFTKTDVRYRRARFYRDIVRIEDVFLAKPTDEYRLDEISIAGTSSGSVGYEALVSGTPVACFGHSSVRNFVGVVDANSVNDTIDGQRAIRDALALGRSAIRDSAKASVSRIAPSGVSVSEAIDRTRDLDSQTGHLVRTAVIALEAHLLRGRGEHSGADPVE